MGELSVVCSLYLVIIMLSCGGHFYETLNFVSHIIQFTHSFYSVDLVLSLFGFLNLAVSDC